MSGGIQGSVGGTLLNKDGYPIFSAEMWLGLRLAARLLGLPVELPPELVRRLGANRPRWDGRTGARSIAERADETSSFRPVTLPCPGTAGRRA